MKIYLLILALVVLSHQKFRNLRNITIFSTTPPQIICLSPYEIAYQYQSSIVTYNITNQQILQNISLPQQSPIQILPLHSALLYLNNNTLYQLHSTAEDEEYFSDISATSWPSKISSFKDKFISATYSKAGEAKQFKIYGPKPWNIQSVTWPGLDGQNITGASGPNFIGDNQFYFAAGGTCNGANGQIYLQKGTLDSIQNVYNFTLDNCDFGSANRDWTLQTYQSNGSNYHLLTYVSQKGSPYQYTSQLVSSMNDTFTEVAHFDVDRLIGVTLASEQAVYTADISLCRVLEHDIQNHEHQHKPSVFVQKPRSIFVAASQNLMVTTEPSKMFQGTVAAVLYKVDQNITITQQRQFGYISMDIVRAELLSQRYLFYFTNNISTLLLDSIIDFKTYPTNVSGIIDFCVSNQDKIFVLSMSGIQVLSVYLMINDNFVLNSSYPLFGQTFETITCLDNNYVLLNPPAGKNLTVFQHQTSIIQTSTIIKDAKIHATFTYANDFLIFTSSNSNQSVFYDYNFNKLNQSFNSPPESQYQIVDSRKGRLILAVGTEVGLYSSLEYYVNQNSSLVYKGSFPFLDDGTADIDKTILFPSKGGLHLEFESPSGEWSTYFDLASPPIQAIGYFYDERDKDCKFFESAVFRIAPGIKQLLLLNTNGSYPILQKYQITNKLTKTQSYPLNKYLITKMGLQLTNKNQIIIRGIDENRTFTFQVRNLDLLSTVVYSNLELGSIDQVDLEAVDYVNEIMVSLFSTNKTTYQTLNLLFCSNTQNPVALQTSIFSNITAFAACPNCDKIAFTGALVDASANSTILIGDYTDPTIFEPIIIDCPPEIFALSPSGSRIVWSCPNSTLFAYDITQKAFLNISYDNYTKIYELSFVDEYFLLANLDQAIKNILIVTNSNEDYRKVDENVKAGTVSTYAIDYARKVYAIASNASTILIYNFNDTLLEAFTINNTLDISSLSFNSNGQLYVSNNVGTVFAITPAPCSVDQNLISDYCICKQLFIQNGEQCICNYKYSSDNGQCLCFDGFYFNGGNGCEGCSAMCSTCNSGDAFDCKDYSAGFYVIIIGGSLLIVGIVILIIFKMKKRNQKQDTMYTEQKSKLSDKLSEPTFKEQIMVKSYNQ